MALWGSSRQEREHVVSTVRSLGTSSVAGLAAALSISERRAYRLLRETFRFGPAGLRWDNGSRTVSYQGLSFDRAGGIRSTPPTLSMAAPVPMEAVPLAAIPVVTTASPEPPAASVRSPPPRAALYRGKPPTCFKCKTATVATEVDGQFCCPRCGRFERAVPAGAPPLPAPSAPPAAPGNGSALTPPAPAIPDRRSQEMFAAWAIGTVIPCPQCRQPLRHRGVGTYHCPSCGRQVQFSAAGASIAPG